MSEYNFKDTRIENIKNKLVFADQATDNSDIVERLLDAYPDIIPLVLEIIGEDQEAEKEDLRDKIEKLEEKS